MLFRRWLVVQVSYFMFLSPINSQKFTLEEENNNLVGSNCFNILKAKRAFCATLGLRSVSVGMRGRLFSSYWGGLATTFAALGWCSSLLSSLDIACLVAYQRHSEPIILMEFSQCFTNVVTKTWNDLKPPKTTYNHLKKFNNHLQPSTTASKTSTTTRKQSKTI